MSDAPPTDYIEPPAADEVAAYQLPPSLEHHEDLTTARLEGYSWQDIDSDIARRSAAAYSVGYTQPEIDSHLGYIEPQGLQTDLERSWLGQTAADPTLVTGLAGVPRSALTPLDGLSAARMAGYADLPPPDAMDAEPATGPAPLSLDNDELRGRYVDALLGGETRSPLDFAERAAGAFLGVGVDLSPDAIPTVAHAARDLAAGLPSNQDLTDVAIGLAQVGGGVPLTPGMIAVIKDNLADVWAKTGRPLMDIYREANTNPDLLNTLQLPKPAPVEPLPWWATLMRDYEAEAVAQADIGPAAQQGIADWWAWRTHQLKENEDRQISWGDFKKGVTAEQLMHDPSFDVAMGFAGGEIKTVGSKIADVLFPKLAETIRAMPEPKVNVVDPLASAGEAVRADVPISEVLAPSPINTVAAGLAKEMTPGENLVAKIQRLEQIETENRTPNQLEAGGFFQRKLAEMGEEAPRGPEPTIQEIADLAEGHYSAATLANTFDDLLKDSSGAGLNPFSTKARDADQTAYLSPAYRGDFDAARAQIREGRGNADRVAAQAFASLEKYRREINKHLPEFEKEVKLGPAGNPDNTLIGNLYNYMEGRSAGATLKADSPFAPVADVIRTINRDMADRINASGHGQAFIDDYFVHMWKDPKSAREMFGVGRQGSGASLKQRDIPTISEGLARGLEPKILDPIEAQTHYTSAMARHLGWQDDILNVGENTGYIQFHPLGAGPEGWVPLNGAGAKLRRGPVEYQAYAPPGYASAYNRSINQGWYDSPVGGAIYDKLRFVANGMTAAKLAFSGYHAFNIVKEAVAADLTNTLGNLARGQLATGLKNLALTPFDAVTLGARQAYRGGQMTKQYLGVKDYGPEMGEIVDALTGANMRMTGRQAIYRVGNTPTIFQSLQRGTLGRELKQDVSDIFGTADQAPAARIAMAAPRMAEFIFKEAGRVLDTVMAPLFDKYIPAIKNAAAFDEMQSWMRANKSAGKDDLLRQARKISDSMDDRFGEMNQDNLFWNQHAKQSLNLAVVSTGWEWGSLRAFAGAAKDIAKGDFNSTRARWLVSYPITIGLMSAAYQYLKTGNAPQEPLDLAFPKTGGTAYKRDARIIQPGYEKDVGQWYKAVRFAPDFIGSLQGVSEIAGHKGNPFIQALWSTLVSGRDYAGSIRNRPNPPFIGVPGTNWALPPGMANYVKMWAEQFVPIPFQQPRIAGANISDMERFLGFRLAPRYLVDPEGFAKKQAEDEAKANQEAINRAKSYNKNLEDPETHFEPAGPLPQRGGGGGGSRGGGRPRQQRSSPGPGPMYQWTK